MGDIAHRAATQAINDRGISPRARTFLLKSKFGAVIWVQAPSVAFRTTDLTCDPKVGVVSPRFPCPNVGIGIAIAIG